MATGEVTGAAAGRPPDGAAMRRLVEQVSGVVVGDPAAVHLVAAAYVAGGHVLLEDRPGVGKTLLAKTMAATVGGTFGRVQGTPDLLPADLTGVGVWDDQTRHWEFRPGPLFHHVVLIDELNRATPRTQSALLEAMAEGQVTVDGTTHPLPDPFVVLATQNPQLGDLGTFPLVSGQRDRFMLSVSMGRPGREDELAILRGRGGDRALPALAPVADLATWRSLRAALDGIYVHEVVTGYALDVVEAVRRRTGPAHAPSTRAGLMLLRAARGWAVLAGRDFVAPDDVQAVAVACLAHRIVDLTDDDLPTARSWTAQVLAEVPVPPAVAAT